MSLGPIIQVPYYILIDNEAQDSGPVYLHQTQPGCAPCAQLTRLEYILYMYKCTSTSI